MAWPVLHTLVIFTLTNFVFAVVGVMLFRENDPQHFGSVLTGMWTVWICETLDDWEQARDSLLRVRSRGARAIVQHAPLPPSSRLFRKVLGVNMFGCDKYGYYHLPTEHTPLAGPNDPELGGKPWGHPLPLGQDTSC